MELNYEKLASQEFVDTCVIYDRIDRVGLQRAIAQGQRTIVILESNGMSTEGIPVVKQEIRDYFDKPCEVHYSRLSSHPQSPAETGNPRISFDSELYQNCKNEFGRKTLPTLRKKIVRLCNDPRMKKLKEN